MQTNTAWHSKPGGGGGGWRGFFDLFPITPETTGRLFADDYYLLMTMGLPKQKKTINVECGRRV